MPGKVSVYDVLVAVIPGAFFLLAIYVATSLWNDSNVASLLTKLYSIDISKLVAFVVAAFLAGQVVGPLSERNKFYQMFSVGVDSEVAYAVIKNTYGIEPNFSHDQWPLLRAYINTFDESLMENSNRQRATGLMLRGICLTLTLFAIYLLAFTVKHQSFVAFASFFGFLYMASLTAKSSASFGVWACKTIFEIAITLNSSINLTDTSRPLIELKKT